MKPRGAFYAFPKIDLPGPTTCRSCALLRETGVVVVHGSGFGRARHAHFRVVYPPPEEVLTKAYQRIGEWLSKRKS